MIDHLKTRAAAEKYRYGCWAGDPNGRAFDPKHCAEEVCEGGRAMRFYQCGKRPGYGPDELYCRQHDPAAKEKRQAERDRRYREQIERERPKWYASELLEIVRKIAAGHNDPRSLCGEFIKKYDDEA